jgi:hypothetical protein
LFCPVNSSGVKSGTAEAGIGEDREKLGRFFLAILSESLFGVVPVLSLADMVMSVIEWIWSEGSICEIWEIHEWLSAAR